MHILFCLEDGIELHEMESDDVAGVIAAARGQKVIFHDDFYKYDHHVLNHYTDNGKRYQEVIIYLSKY